MRRAFDEISDDEWENHTFKPSKVLKRTNLPSPPPIESFAYQPHASGSTGSYDSPVNLDDEGEGDVNTMHSPHGCGSRGRRFVVDDDSDVEEVVEVRPVAPDDEEISWSEDDADIVEAETANLQEDLEVEEVDVVGRALRKCGKISSALREELYGSSISNYDRYAEVEASSCKIVTQVPASTFAEFSGQPFRWH